MSRTTDAERGARIGFELAFRRAMQPDLFPSAIPAEYWQAIASACLHQLDDAAALREALGGAGSARVSQAHAMCGVSDTAHLSQIETLG